MAVFTGNVLRGCFWTAASTAATKIQQQFCHENHEKHENKHGCWALIRAMAVNERY
jgi:hypothetical protein